MTAVTFKLGSLYNSTHYQNDTKHCHIILPSTVSFPSGYLSFGFPACIPLSQKTGFEVTGDRNRKRKDYLRNVIMKRNCPRNNLPATRASDAEINATCKHIWAWNLLHKRRLFCSHVCRVEMDASTVQFCSWITSLALYTSTWLIQCARAAAVEHQPSCTSMARLWFAVLFKGHCM